MSLITSALIAAQKAEFEHYHPGKKMTSMTWQPTDAIVIKKMCDAYMRVLFCSNSTPIANEESQ
jgi:hypothetical protein